MSDRHLRRPGILLVNPRNPAYRSNLPLGLAYIAAILKRSGYTVEILPCDLYHLENIHIAKYICMSKQKVIGITGVYPDLREIVRLSNFIKNACPNKIVVLGGPLVTSLPVYVMDKTGADVGVFGEAESVIIPLMEGIELDFPAALHAVPNVIFREGDQLVSSTSDTLLMPIDEIPWPARELFPMSYYLRTTKYPLDPWHACQIEMLSARGCPHHCSFCYHSGPFRLRAVADVLDEIESCMAAYEATHFYFRDDLFMSSEHRVVEFREALMSRDLAITYHINGKLDVVSPHILRILKRSGCIMIGYGLESADQTILDAMGKGFTVEQAEEGIRQTRKHGIYAVYSVMWGYPGDDDATMQKLISLLNRLAYGEFNERYPYACTPFPDSPLYRWALESGRIRSHDDFYERFRSMRTPAVNMTDMSDVEFIRCFDAAHAELRSLYAARASLWRDFFCSRR